MTRAAGDGKAVKKPKFVHRTNIVAASDMCRGGANAVCIGFSVLLCPA